jgi:membrane-associated phospholipid phosphatase
LKKLVIVLTFVFAALLVSASFFDLQIAAYVYNPQSVFAKFFSVAGMLPQYAVQILSPGMILAALFELRRTRKIAAVTSTNTMAIAAVAVLLADAVCFYGTLVQIQSEVGVPAAAQAAVIVFFIFISFLASLPFAKKKSNELMITALTGLVAFIAGYALLQTLKTFWGRPRFYIMDDPATQFTKWYLPQGKTSIDDFKSFPSGHSFAAMCAVWFALWPAFINGLKKYARLILALALLFGFAAMAARMIYGRHFLSDVTVGAAISLISFALSKKLIIKM